MPKQTSSRKAYDTDLTNAQWELIASFFPPPRKTGRPRSTEPREVVNAILYVLRSGCTWRLLPHDFPDWKLVYHYFTDWQEDGTWYQLHETLRGLVRLEAGKDPEPSAAILDSQSVKTTEKGGRMVMMRVKR